MGKRGPKPKSTVVRMLEGNPGRLPLNPIEPQIGEPAVKTVPVINDPIANAEWDMLTGIMPPGVYTAADSGVLAQHCLAVSALYHASEDLRLNGWFIELHTTDKETGEILYLRKDVNPAVKLWKTAQEVLLKTSDRLGLSPGVRSKLQVPTRDASPSSQSKFAGLIQGR